VADFSLSLLLLILLSPVFLITALVLSIANKGQPFFTQLRPGKDEKPFRVIKFRTMNEKMDNFGNLLPDEQRLTSAGNWVRRLSLDEIPQLINVLQGDMSLIGPRPLLMEYLPFYNEKQRKRHYVKPGITGWAQVNGRNLISWEDKFEFDCWYVENVSFIVDLRILVKTIWKILKMEGISSTTSVSMEKFQGSEMEKSNG
jgi:lipopolysaccharide/colanic/teichoic acid biosynthesis glycosyltransferase